MILWVIELSEWRFQRENLTFLLNPRATCTSQCERIRIIFTTSHISLYFEPLNKEIHKKLPGLSFFSIKFKKFRSVSFENILENWMYSSSLKEMILYDTTYVISYQFVMCSHIGTMINKTKNGEQLNFFLIKCRIVLLQGQNVLLNITMILDTNMLISPYWISWVLHTSEKENNSQKYI